MSIIPPPAPGYRMTFTRLFVRSMVRHIYQLPISFYLVLAIIIVLLLGLKGFEDLTDPRRLAFTVTLFVIFFGTVTYRAIVDAFEIARKYRREQDSLLTSVFGQDDLAKTLGSRVAKIDDSADPVEF